MNIYRASDGAHDTSPLHPADFPSLAHLRKAISNLVDIPLENLILFLEDGGSSLDEAIFERLWEGGVPNLGGGGKPGSQMNHDDEAAISGKRAYRLSIASPPDLLDVTTREPIGIFAFDQLSFQVEDVHAFVAGLEDSLVLCDITGNLQSQDLSVSRAQHGFDPGLSIGQNHLGGVTIPDSGLPIHPIMELNPLLPFQENLSQILHLRERMSNQLRALELAGGSLNNVWAGMMGTMEKNKEETTYDLRGSDSEDSEGDVDSIGPRIGRRNRVRSGDYPRLGHPISVSLHQSRIIPPSSWLSYESLISTELAREESLIARPRHHTSAGRNDEEAISPGTELPPLNADADTPEISQVWGMEQDMQVIRAIPIHESFLAKRGKGKEKEKDKDKEKENEKEKEKVEKKKMLGDYVNAGKMSTVRDSCQRMYDDHLARFTKLQSTTSELSASISEITHSSVRLTQDAHHEAVSIVDIVERLVEEASRIALEDLEVHWQSLRGLDGAVREQVIHMTDLKNDVNLQLHIHLQQISLRQSTIAELPKIMADLAETLRNTQTVHRTGFPHLERLRNMARAYGQTCVEVVWRKEMAQLLLEGAGSLAEGVAGFLSEETARRGEFARRVLELLPPFETESLGKSETYSVSFDLSVRSGLDDPQDWSIASDDISRLCRMLENLRTEPGMDKLPLHGKSNPLADALDWIRDAQAQKDRSIADLHVKLSPAARGLSTHETQPDRVDELEEAVKGMQLESHRAREGYEAARASFQADLENQQQECERLTLDLEDREAILSSLRTESEEYGKVAADLRRALAAEVAARCEAQAELDAVRAQLSTAQRAREEDLAHIDNLRAERSQILEGLSDARNDEEAVAVRVVALQSELDSAFLALEEARSDRDEALRRSVTGDSPAALEQIAHLVQDRTSLEQKLEALSANLEETKSTHQQVIASHKRAAEREADSLNAELSFARAHLREEKRKTAKLESDVKEAQSSVTVEVVKSNALASKGVQVAFLYHDCIARLQAAIHSSATISGSVSGSVLALDEKPILSVPSAMMKHGMHAGSTDLHVLENELALLEKEDLQSFSEAVSRTMGLVKKWQKSAKQYRDRAKNGIAFSNFAKGDLALFLPTRNATTKPWAAFNISSPHNFLKPEGEIAEQIKTREWLVARITRIEDDVAQSDRPESNPYGLADGIRYQLLYVEPYVPGAPVVKRRNTDGQRPQMPHAPSTFGAPQQPGPIEAAISPPRRASHARTRSQQVADGQEVASNPFEGPVRSNVSPASPTQRASEVVRADLPFAMRPRGEGVPIPRRPPSIASSSGSFGRPRKSVGAIGKSGPTAGVVTTADGQMGARITQTGQVESSGGPEGSSVPMGRRDSGTSGRSAGSAAETLRKLGKNAGGQA